MKFPCDVIIHCEPNEKGTVITMTGWNELVRCKDCKYSVDEYGDGECYCRTKREMLRYIGDWNNYCSWAERKE